MWWQTVSVTEAPKTQAPPPVLGVCRGRWAMCQRGGVRCMTHWQGTEGAQPPAYLGVLAPHVSAHGGPCGHLRPAQLAALRLHFVVCELNVLLQHVFGHVLLVAHRARPLLAHFSHTHTRTWIGRHTQVTSAAIPMTLACCTRQEACHTLPILRGPVLVPEHT